MFLFLGENKNKIKSPILLIWGEGGSKQKKLTGFVSLQMTISTNSPEGWTGLGSSRQLVWKKKSEQQHCDRSREEVRGPCPPLPGGWTQLWLTDLYHRLCCWNPLWLILPAYRRNSHSLPNVAGSNTKAWTHHGACTPWPVQELSKCHLVMIWLWDVPNTNMVKASSHHVRS